MQSTSTRPPTSAQVRSRQGRQRGFLVVEGEGGAQPYHGAPAARMWWATVKCFSQAGGRACQVDVARRRRSPRMSRHPSVPPPSQACPSGCRSRAWPALPSAQPPTGPWWRPMCRRARAVLASSPCTTILPSRPAAMRRRRCAGRASIGCAGRAACSAGPVGSPLHAVLSVAATSLPGSHSWSCCKSSVPQNATKGGQLA